MVVFNILDTISDILKKESSIAKSVDGIFQCYSPEKIYKAFITLELLNFKTSLSKNCTAEVKLSVQNAHYIKNITNVIGSIESIFNAPSYDITVRNVVLGCFSAREIFKKIGNKHVTFSVNLLIKLN